MKHIEEVSITKLSSPTCTWYEVCFVYGLLDTYTVQIPFATVRHARDYIKAHTMLGQKLPIIVQ
jgi:hypothetical protein